MLVVPLIDVGCDELEFTVTVTGTRVDAVHELPDHEMEAKPLPDWKPWEWDTLVDPIAV